MANHLLQVCKFLRPNQTNVRYLNWIVTVAGNQSTHFPENIWILGTPTKKMFSILFESRKKAPTPTHKSWRQKNPQHVQRFSTVIIISDITRYSSQTHASSNSVSRCMKDKSLIFRVFLIEHNNKKLYWHLSPWIFYFVVDRKGVRVKKKMLQSICAVAGDGVKTECWPLI